MTKQNIVHSQYTKLGLYFKLDITDMDIMLAVRTVFVGQITTWSPGIRESRIQLKIEQIHNKT